MTSPNLLIREGGPAKWVLVIILAVALIASIVVGGVLGSRDDNAFAVVVLKTQKVFGGLDDMDSLIADEAWALHFRNAKSDADNAMSEGDHRLQCIATCYGVLVPPKAQAEAQRLADQFGCVTPLLDAGGPNDRASRIYRWTAYEYAIRYNHVVLSTVRPKNDPLPNKPCL